MKPRVRYTSGQVCRITGVTMRELDGWCRKGLICPNPSANEPETQTHTRHWTPGAILCVALLKRVSTAAGNLRFLASHLHELELADQAHTVDLTLRIDLSDVTATLATLQPIRNSDDLHERRASRNQPTSPPTNINRQPTPDPEPLPPPQRIRKTRKPDRTRRADRDRLGLAPRLGATFGEPDARGRMADASSLATPIVHSRAGYSAEAT